MYEPNLYQRVKSISYLALPVVASLYLSGCPTESPTALESQKNERAYKVILPAELEAEKNKEAYKVILEIKKRDNGTIIERRIVNADQVIACDLETIAELHSEKSGQQESIGELQKERPLIFTFVPRE